MKILNCEQGSVEWLNARLGLPTASSFSRIITPKGNPAAASDRYLADLVVEWFLGEHVDAGKTDFMNRGNELEPDAVKAYEFANDVDVQRVGLCLRDDGKAGASPDGLVGTDGLAEIKSPSASIHMMYLLDGPPSDYWVQIQGQLYITGRAWNDLYCHHPVFDPVVKRYTRDEDFIEKLATALDAFVLRLDAAKERFGESRATYLEAKKAREEAMRVYWPNQQEEVPPQFVT